MSTPQHKQIHILFIFRRDRQRRLDLKRADLGPDEMLYGMTHFDQSRFKVDFIEANQARRTLLGMLWRPIEKCIGRAVGMGFTLAMIRQHRRALEQADVVVCTTDACGLPLAMLKYRGRLTTPVVYFSQGLSDRIQAMPDGKLSRRLAQEWYGKFLRSIEQIVVLGEGARQPLIDLFELDSQRVTCAAFGIDNQFWTPGAEPAAGDYILSVGSDPARDYATLFEAVGDAPLKIVTRIDLSKLRRPRNVEIVSELTDVQLRQLYRDARFVVTPLKDVTQPSGQSATLQAMACAQAVILTNTRGLWEPRLMQHNHNCLLVKPRDKQELQTAIQCLLNDPQQTKQLGDNARNTVESSCTSKHFADRLSLLVQQLAAGRDQKVIRSS